MADLQLTCTRCFTITTVSEFVDDAALICRSCGAVLPRPVREETPGKRHRVSTEARGVHSDGEETGGYKDGNPAELWPGGSRAPKARKKVRVMHHWYSLALFVVFGAAMGFIRYGNVLDAGRMELLHTYAAPAAIVLHFLIVLKAFEDQVFQGILCLLIPFYSLFYLFAVSDSVYLRALVGGLMVGIAQDAAEVLQVEFMRICEFVRAWISRGG